MKIAIIGTGNIGAAYARALAKTHYDVIIGDRDPSKAAILAQEIGTNIEGGGINAAFQLADLVILALPYQAIINVLAEAEDLTDKVLVDVSNPISENFQDLVVGLTTSAAEQIQDAAPKAHIVKSFNTIFAGLVPTEAREDRQLQVFVAGDNAKAIKQVRELAQTLGFIAVNAGPLRNSRFLEPIGMMNIQFGFFLDAGPTTAPAWSHT